MNKKVKKKLMTLILILFVSVVSIYYEDIKSFKEEHIQPRVVEGVEQVTAVDDTDSFSVTVVDVGQADSILLETDGKYALIDAGNNADSKKLVSYYSDLGISEFEHVIATHAHEDHIGGIDDIINNFQIKNFYMPGYISTTKTFEDVLDALEVNNVELEVPVIGQQFTLGKAKIKVLYVDSDARDINDSYIVLRVVFGSNSFLFMGDASSLVENKILNDGIASDLLKVGHHGSDTSSSVQFLNKVNPQYALISVGEGNVYEHPHNTTLDRLKNKGIKIFRTDLDNTIKATSNGTIIALETFVTDTDG